MGWGTDFTAEIYLNRQVFHSSYELDDKIDELENEINDIKGRLLMYASTNVKDIIPDEWKDEPITFIHLRVNEELALLQEKCVELYRLFLYKETNPDYTKNKDL